MKTQPTRVVNYVLGIFGVLLLTVILIEIVMSPPSNDLRSLSLYLGFTGLVSAIFGFISFKLGWWRRLPRLRYALIIGYILAGGLTLFNVWVTAQMMFLNEHDLVLGSLLLVFAGGISVAFGFFISNAITTVLGDLVEGAERLSRGDFSTRVQVEGQDEIAQLSRSFNQMAARLESAAETEQAIDEARRNLVAWASHDLRTPLTSLRAMIDALADGVVGDPETVSRYLNQSQNEITRMSTLIDDLFELAQIDAGFEDLDCQWVSLSDLVSDTLESFTARSESIGVRLDGFVGSDVDPVWAAPDKLSRIMDNLVHNALRHSSKGGSIHIHADREDETILVRVEDTGSGIVEEDLDRIFDRFYRGERSRSRAGNGDGGVGLGLAIVKGLVEAHGGRIWVESKPNQGTTFWFTLPGHNGDNAR
ncbi:MAG: cell wall metabolism sensor histidine kinase WalK [Anaerolineae bacterium]|nr:cell wall metabolism sensor histidine kinase WalK [Anaerolineae bacterium]